MELSRIWYYILTCINFQQLQTWFRWRVNASKKNRSLKKESTVFDDALQPKRRAKSEAEIYSDMYYDERIKPLVKAEEEAGNAVSSGRRVALGRKFSKELLDDEDEDVKAQVREIYEQQLKAHQKHGKKKPLDGDQESDKALGSQEIARYGLVDSIKTLRVNIHPQWYR
jgi:hypothetical protein